MGFEWSRIEYLYCQEVVGLGLKASIAFNNIHSEVSAPNSNPERIHDEIDTILESAHRISLILFPKNWAKQKKSDDEKFWGQRGERLRGILGVLDSSPLANQLLRNHVAHFDERIDRWFRGSDNKTYGRRMLGSRNDTERLGVNSEDILSMYDPTSGVYAFWEDDLDMRSVERELKMIELAARNFLQQAVRPNLKSRQA